MGTTNICTWNSTTGPMRNGGPRPGAGRPKQRTVLEVALSLSAPAAWEASEPRTVIPDTTPVSVRYKPSAASAARSSIPAAAIRRQEIDTNAGRARRSLSELEHELVERLHASTSNDTTVHGFRAGDEKLFDRNDPSIDAIVTKDHVKQVSGREPGCSMGDFLYERGYDGTMWPTEIRGLKWIR
jgi:hypothetical protein